MAREASSAAAGAMLLAVQARAELVARLNLLEQFPGPKSYRDDAATMQAALSGNEIIVQPGDTLYSISRAHHVSLAELMSASRHIDAHGVSDGEWQAHMAEREEMGDRHELLVTAMKDLTDRERDILQARRLQDEPATLEELSQKYGVSRERVRQIQIEALTHLRRIIKRGGVTRDSLL